MSQSLTSLLQPFGNSGKGCQEAEKLATKFIDKKLTEISDPTIDWKYLLDPVVKDFMQLAAVSDELRFRFGINFWGPNWGPEACEAQFALTQPMILGCNSNRLAQMMFLEIEQSCVPAIDFMLEKHNTTFGQARSAMMARLETARLEEFERLSRSPPAMRKKRRKLERKNAPWRINR